MTIRERKTWDGGGNDPKRTAMMNERDDGLDGARGIAAMAVVLSHVAAMTWVPFVDGAGNGSTLERALWHLGAPAVDLFLVLSGYVVARSLLRRPVEYFPYLLGRLVRLLPVAWIAIGLGLALRSAGLHAPSGTSSGLLELASPLTSADVIGLMTLVAPVPNVDVISPPLWTLVLEMQAAYAMPLLAYVSRRAGAFVLLAVGIPLLFIASFMINLGYPLVFTGFLVGAAFAGAEARIPKLKRAAPLMVASLVILLSRHILKTDDVLMRIVCALGAGGVVMAIRNGSGAAVLRSPLAQRLGSISYPLYAVHWPIMAAAVMTLGWKTGPTIAAIVSIPLSLMVAVLIEQIVDRRAVTLSRLIRR